MNTKPMLFSGHLVRALLEGRKVQTRRPASVESLPNGMITPVSGYAPRSPEEHLSYCPYGQPGDLIWVRETWASVHFSVDYESGICDDIYDLNGNEDGEIIYRASFGADDEDIECRGFKWRPSIHMPRWASRLTLRITNVRIERLQDISENDAASEGIEVFNEDGNLWYSGYMQGEESWFDSPEIWHCNDPVQAFKELWDGINYKLGKGWATNPWVWVLDFEVIKANVDDVLKKAGV